MELFPFYSIGHFINDPKNPTEFEITLFNEMEEPEVDDFHKHTFYEILWIDEGISRQIIDFKEYEIEPNSFFFISPGQVHQFEEWQPIQGGTIMFTSDFYLLNHPNQDNLFELSFLDNFYSNASIKLNEIDFKEIKSYIDLLVKEFRKKDVNLVICRSLLHIILLTIERSVDSKRGEKAQKKLIILYKNFKNLLDIHFKENTSSIFYSEKLNITPHHLNEVVKTLTGKTTTEMIRERMILEAKRYLTFTDLPISEIAGEFKYFDSSYFSRLFKKETGYSPRDFKSVFSEKYRKRPISF